MNTLDKIEENNLEWLITLYINATLNKDDYFNIRRKDENSYELVWKDNSRPFCMVYRDAIIDILRYMINEEE